jgi:glycosyltransferase involved in cell wall biosynthesis
MKNDKKTFSQDRLREIAWEIGAKYPIPLAGDHTTLLMVTPRLGYVQWQVQKESVKALKVTHGEGFNGATLVVRVYDVTDILFDGYNAHMFFDLGVHGLSGNNYFEMGRLERRYLAEVGFRLRDGSFHCLARSNTASFDRDRPSGDYHIAGLFVGGRFNRVFSIENIFDAPVYENMNRELSGISRKGPLSVAVVFLGINHSADLDSPLGSFIKMSSKGIKQFGAKVRLFTPRRRNVSTMEDESLLNSLDTLSERILKQVVAGHKKTPFHLIHCHDWYSSAVGLNAAKSLNLPMILTLYSTEYERTRGNHLNHLSSTICEWEKRGVQGADLIIVPHSSTGRQVIEQYGVAPEKVVIIPDALAEDSPSDTLSPSEVRRGFGLNKDAPLVLFSGEISHASGADLMVDALPTVCQNNNTAQFVFAGEGPLKEELQGRTWNTGIGHRCRFVGHVSGDSFEALLTAADFVVIPARTWQDQGLALKAIGCGRPVLTTHQAGLDCVIHGENGLVTFDNPGSIIWGIQELLSNHMQGSMLRLVAKKSIRETPSIENIAAQHYMHYEYILKSFQGAKHA